MKEQSKWLALRYISDGTVWYGVMHREMRQVMFCTRNGWEAQSVLRTIRAAERKLPLTSSYEPGTWEVMPE